jgi:hypothetical protein
MDKKLIADEIDELQRVVQDLKRNEDLDISLGKLVTAFSKSKEVELSKDIWDKLENTESNDVEKGQMNLVKKIAKRYGKTDPEILSKSLESGEYHRPLIVKLDGDRYHLVAGNTRLCTAKAMGMIPNVFIADISGNKEETKESTDAGSSGSSEGPLFGKSSTIKRRISKIPNMNLNEVTTGDAGEYDVPLFGTSPKGRKNPLKIDGPDSIYKGRAVKDRDFPKWGGPDSVFVKVKEKCKKFPYCNQGDMNALEIIKEDDELILTIKETAKKYGISYKHMESIVLNEINKIFI